MVEKAKHSAIVARETAMRSDPLRRMGLRPTRSTRKIATSVTRTLITEVNTLIPKDDDSSNPTDCHSVVE